MPAHRAKIAAAALLVVSANLSASPLQINEAGFDNPATVYPQPRAYARTSGSPFPWAVNEAGPYVAESAPLASDAGMRTARK